MATERNSNHSSRFIVADRQGNKKRLQTFWVVPKRSAIFLTIWKSELLFTLSLEQDIRRAAGRCFHLEEDALIQRALGHGILGIRGGSNGLLLDLCDHHARAEASRSCRAARLHFGDQRTLLRLLVAVLIGLLG